VTRASLPWLEVKNWKEHQHYGEDREMLWIKVYSKLLNDYTFTRLPEVTRYHLLAIWLVASRSGGLVPNDAEWLGSQISAATSPDLDTLVEAGFLIPVARKRPASELLDQSRVEERREEERRSTTPDARWALLEAEIRGGLPEEYREDFDAQVRASRRPEALLAELRNILAGTEPSTKGATVTEVGAALRDASMTVGALTGGKLRGFVRGAMRGRGSTSATKAETPKTGLPKASILPKVIA
jgi:hypothetical protein